MAIEEKRPKWHKHFASLIESCWEHHGPCVHITLKWAYDDESRTWMILAAPVFQEVLGGEDDGKTVWTGFIFHSDAFNAAEGIFIEHFAVSSNCKMCSAVPRMMFTGKFRGRKFYLQVYLEPVPESPVVELIDTINEEIKDAVPHEHSGASQGEDQDGDEDQEPGERRSPGLPGETSTD